MSTHTANIDMRRDSQDLFKALAVKPAFVGRYAYLPLLSDPGVTLRFSARQLKFLRLFKHTRTLEEAAALSGYTPERAKAFLRSKKCAVLLEEAAKQDGVAEFWRSREACYDWGDRVLEGKKDPSDVQFKVWSEFFSRAVPKPKEGMLSANVVQINISSEAVREANRRIAEVAA